MSRRPAKAEARQDEDCASTFTIAHASPRRLGGCWQATNTETASMKKVTGKTRLASCPVCLRLVFVCFPACEIESIFLFLFFSFSYCGNTSLITRGDAAVGRFAKLVRYSVEPRLCCARMYGTGCGMA
jgi:hypothetical protein